MRRLAKRPPAAKIYTYLKGDLDEKRNDESKPGNLNESRNEFVHPALAVRLKPR